jgi:hypothetical protein
LSNEQVDTRGRFLTHIGTSLQQGTFEVVSIPGMKFRLQSSPIPRSQSCDFSIYNYNAGIVVGLSVFHSMRKYSCFQNALAYSWRCNTRHYVVLLVSFSSTKLRARVGNCFFYLRKFVPRFETFYSGEKHVLRNRPQLLSA